MVRVFSAVADDLLIDEIIVIRHDLHTFIGDMPNRFFTNLVALEISFELLGYFISPGVFEHSFFTENGEVVAVYRVFPGQKMIDKASFPKHSIAIPGATNKVPAYNNPKMYISDTVLLFHCLECLSVEYYKPCK